MTPADYSLMAFTVLNGARVAAYVPQMLCVHRDHSGATAVSLTTWGLFTLANVATVSYALTISGDLVIAGVFALNAIGCLSIVALTTRKRIALAKGVLPNGWKTWRHFYVDLAKSAESLAIARRIHLRLNKRKHRDAQTKTSGLLDRKL
jgi:hypothetical protein